MKLKAQQIYEEIPAENIDELEQTLKDIGFEEQKIREIIDPLKKQVETTTTPEEPPTPGIPEEPKTGPEQSKHVLQPGMTMKRLQRVDPNEIFEETVEEYLDQGEEFDIAVHKAHKHLERVVDYLELHGQRELKGPAKGKVFGDSLYDRLGNVLSVLQAATSDNVEYDNKQKEFDTVCNDLIADLDGIVFDQSITEQKLIEKSFDWKSKVEQLKELKEDIEDAFFMLKTSIDESDLLEFAKIVDEVKQVGLDTQAGTTSPIDLGEWLY